MHILVTTDIFPPEAGGPARYVPTIAEALARRGHTVQVLTYSPGEAGPEDGNHPFRVRRISVAQGRLLRLGEVCAALSQGLRWADLLYTNGLLIEAALVNAIYHRPSVAKVVGDIAWERARDKGWIDDEFEQFQRRRFGWRIELRRTLRNWALRQMRAVIVPSAYLKRIVTGWGVEASRLYVIYNAFEPVVGNDPPADIPLATPHRLITVCRLTAWKGVDGLIETIASLPDVGLVVVGDGPERENLEALVGQLGVGERVHFAGRVPGERVHAYLRACDLFVLNSRYEGLPHVVLEALAAGLPVVATDAGGTGEVIQDGVNGRLVSIGDMETFRQAVVQLLRSPNYRRKLATAGSQTLAQFSVEKMIAETAKILGAAAGDRI